MPIGSPQSSAGIMSFYDAQTDGPKFNAKHIIALVIVFAVIVIVVNHFIFYG